MNRIKYGKLILEEKESDFVYNANEDYEVDNKVSAKVDVPTRNALKTLKKSNQEKINHSKVQSLKDANLHNKNVKIDKSKNLKESINDDIFNKSIELLKKCGGKVLGKRQFHGSKEFGTVAIDVENVDFDICTELFQDEFGDNSVEEVSDDGFELIITKTRTEIYAGSVNLIINDWTSDTYNNKDGQTLKDLLTKRGSGTFVFEDENNERLLVYLQSEDKEVKQYLDKQGFDYMQGYGADINYENILIVGTFAELLESKEQNLKENDTSTFRGLLNDVTNFVEENRQELMGKSMRDAKELYIKKRGKSYRQLDDAFEIVWDNEPLEESFDDEDEDDEEIGGDIDWDDEEPSGDIDGDDDGNPYMNIHSFGPDFDSDDEEDDWVEDEEDYNFDDVKCSNCGAVGDFDNNGHCRSCEWDDGYDEFYDNDDLEEDWMMENKGNSTSIINKIKKALDTFDEDNHAARCKYCNVEKGNDYLVTYYTQEDYDKDYLKEFISYLQPLADEFNVKIQFIYEPRENSGKFIPPGTINPNAAPKKSKWFNFIKKWLQNDIKGIEQEEDIFFDLYYEFVEDALKCMEEDSTTYEEISQDIIDNLDEYLGSINLSVREEKDLLPYFVEWLKWLKKNIDEDALNED